MKTLNIENSRVHSVVTNQTIFKSDLVVLTTGAWSKQYWSALFPQLQLEAVKGQIILIKQPLQRFKTIIIQGNHYLVPRLDGSVLVGSTLEKTEFDKAISDDAKTQLQRFAIDLMPDLEKYPITHQWAGLRPAAPKGIPYIDRHPTIENLAINCGHFRNGITTAPASAKLIADLLLHRTLSIPAAPYSLEAKR